MVLKTRRPEETRKLGERLGRALRGLDVLCLRGDLGSGKTTFTQGLARGAGYKGRAVSPTFVLAKVYRAKALNLYHLDLYRLAPGVTGDVGIEEYVSDPKAACIIEWPEAGAAYYPKERLEVSFTRGKGEEDRTLSFKAKGARSRELLRKLS